MKDLQRQIGHHPTSLHCVRQLKRNWRRSCP